MTVVVMAVALLAGVVLNYLIPEDVFLLIASIATFATVWVWLMILLSQFAARRRMSPRQVAALKFPVPLWPAAPLAAIGFMLLVLGVLGYFPTPVPRWSWAACGSCCWAPPTCCGCAPPPRVRRARRCGLRRTRTLSRTRPRWPPPSRHRPRAGP